MKRSVGVSTRGEVSEIKIKHYGKFKKMRERELKTKSLGERIKIVFMKMRKEKWP